MQRHKIALVGTAGIAVFAIIAQLHGANARPNQVGGHYNCYCEGGNSGTCSTTTTNGNAKCEKNSGDTCTGSCKMVTFTPSATGGAITHGGDSGGSAGSPGKAK